MKFYVTNGEQVAEIIQAETPRAAAVAGLRRAALRGPFRDPGRFVCVSERGEWGDDGVYFELGELATDAGLRLE